MNSPYVQWIKSNLLIVIFGIIAIAALISLPMISGSMNNEVSEKLAKRKQLEQQMTRLQSTPIELQNPSPLVESKEQQPSLINQAALREFTEYKNAREAEAEQIAERAEQRNRRGRGVLMPALFPKVAPGESQEVLTYQMSEALNAAYRDLLKQLNAGEAPSLAEMKETLVRQQKQFITTRLNKEDRSELTPEELEELRKDLGATRLAIARDHASEIKIYAGLDAINPPSWDQGQNPTPTIEDLFEWQWDLWAIEDILLAIDALNETDSSVLDAPVKRIIQVTRVGGDERTSRRGGGGAPSVPGGGGGGPFIAGGGGGGGNIGPGGGGRGEGIGDGGRPKGGDSPPSGKSSDPTKQIPRDYSYSFTGRTTNPLYDVREYRLKLVVESDQVRDVIDSLGRQNFMTVIGVILRPADPYTDLESGYVYGGRSAVEVVLNIETIWLRSWTTEFMPDATKMSLDIPVDVESNSGTP